MTEKNKRYVIRYVFGDKYTDEIYPDKESRDKTFERLSELDFNSAKVITANSIISLRNVLFCEKIDY